MLVLLSVNSLRSQIAWKISYIWCQHVNGLVLLPCLALVNQGELCREWLVMHGKHPPFPQSTPNSLSHPPFSSALFSGGGDAFCSANRQSSLQSLPVPPLHSCMQSKASSPFLSIPLLSIPLLCCGERAKARKAHTGSLECLQAIREMISAVKESLFQGRVNSLFILAFAARRD